ncbi:MAG: amidohydrolase family protein [Chloroflexi bacterium]|nr:amidohydrolase family protein [Chloroflexota bacterium]
MIVDVHTHMFSHEVRADRERLVGIEPWFGELYASPKARLASPDEVADEIAAAGVDRAVALGFPWRDLGRCRAENDAVLAAARRRPSLIPFGMVPPLAGPDAVREMERCVALGMRGFGEINPDGQGFAIDDETAFGPIATAAAALDVPLLIHCSEPVGHAYPGKGANGPGALYRFLQRHPTTRVILAHWGGGLLFYELMPEVRAACANVVYDTAASPYLYGDGVFRVAVQVAGVERILIGSDFPLIRPGRMLRLVDRLGLAEDECRLLLGGNACRFLGLPVPVAAGA